MTPMRLFNAVSSAAILLLATSANLPSALAQTTVTGQAAFGDYTTDAPGKRRHITPGDLPKPFDTEAPRNQVKVVGKPNDGQLQVPAGFEIKQFASGLQGPR